MSLLKKSLTFSNVIAMLALFMALGGTVYAASGQIDGAQIKAKSLPGNRLQPKSIGAAQIKSGAIAAGQIKAGSVGAAQIKAGAVAAAQIHSGAVNATKIQANSITGAQIKAGSIGSAQIQSGSLGAAQINQTTLTAINAASIHNVQYVTATVALNAEATGGTNGTAVCPSGTKAIGGGAITSNSKFAYIIETAPTSTGTSWIANGVAFEPGVTMTVTAICTPVS
jgi:hypothetical protein